MFKGAQFLVHLFFSGNQVMFNKIRDKQTLKRFFSSVKNQDYKGIPIILIQSILTLLKNMPSLWYES